MLKSAIKKQLIKKPLLYEWALRALQKSEAQEVMVLRKIVRSGDTVFDIGANVGQFTCLLAHLAGSKGAVHAFEPIPPVFHKLQNNISRNGLSSTVLLNQCALSDKKGFVQMYVPACDF
ncbi:FkbM family methyltransferase, partial [Candidatus Bathyarchaeota archaeon]|nr:FkbM family methyltransferase [Candidatus Bathyarchaeota archaeon]